MKLPQLLVFSLTASLGTARVVFDRHAELGQAPTWTHTIPQRESEPTSKSTIAALRNENSVSTANYEDSPSLGARHTQPRRDEVWLTQRRMPTQVSSSALTPSATPTPTRTGPHIQGQWRGTTVGRKQWYYTIIRDREHYSTLTKKTFTMGYEATPPTSTTSPITRSRAPTLTLSRLRPSITTKTKLITKTTTTTTTTTKPSTTTKITTSTTTKTTPTYTTSVIWTTTKYRTETETLTTTESETITVYVETTPAPEPAPAEPEYPVEDGYTR